MSGNLNFDANTVEPEGQSFDPLPAGEYSVLIVDSDVMNTKSGTGQYLKLELLVTAGPYENRRLFSNLNIVNQNPDAQRIGQGQLSALCRAVGKLQVGDSADLHNLPFVVKVAVKNDHQYGPQNAVKAFKPTGGGQPPVGYQPPAQPTQQAAPQQQAAATAQPSNANAGKRPWER